MRFRPATKEDDDRVVALMEALYREDPSPESPDTEGARRTLAKLRAEPVRGRVLVLEDDRRVIGYAIIASYWSNELGGEIGVLDELYVEPMERGRGHATRLIGELLGGRVDGFRGARAFELEVTPDNARARALYERLGFKPTKNTRMRWRPQGA